jgi:hypothetical protein
MADLLNANVGGLTVVEKPGMHRSGWFLTDAAGRVLRSGVIGMGEIKTPGADQDSATTIECGADLYAALIAKMKETGNG